MSIKGDIDKMKKDGDGAWDRILQSDGSYFYYRPQKDTYRSFLLYAMDCWKRDSTREPRRPTPPLITAVANAQDRDGVMRKMFPEWPANPPTCAFKLDRLIRDGVVEEDWYAWGASDEWGDEDD
jgi:hypothetical protein